ncbi:universal stress protein [Fulvimarina sp. MAC8]|uniref:universal stress protein n=1 Tax=Fulvimarina sp. MAC8 TaxID=3162874 RepID=UPI0032EFD11A
MARPELSLLSSASVFWDCRFARRCPRRFSSIIGQQADFAGSLTKRSASPVKHGAAGGKPRLDRHDLNQGGHFRPNKESHMYKKILIAIAPDHLDAASESLAAARALADEGAIIHVISVINRIPNYVVAEVGGEVYERSSDKTKKALAKILKDFDDIEVKTFIGEPPARIISTAKEGNYDLIVIRSHKPGVRDWFLGSTAGRVTRSTPCAVHILR